MSKLFLEGFLLLGEDSLKFPGGKGEWRDGSVGAAMRSPEKHILWSRRAREVGNSRGGTKQGRGDCPWRSQSLTTLCKFRGNFSKSLT